MDASDRDSLLAALDQLGSADDAEALAAARTVHALATGAGLDWDEILPLAADEIAADELDEAADAEAVIEEAAADGMPALGARDEGRLIERLLARTDLSAETRQELVEFQAALAGGRLDEMDRRYLRALAARLGR